MFNLHVKISAHVTFAVLCFSSAASANLILTEYDSNTPIPDSIGGYEMTAFDVVNGGSIGDGTSTVETPFGDLLIFTDKNGATLDMTRGLADSINWWVNGEVDDYDIFTTSVNWVTILLPSNTQSLSFSVGANSNAGGWIKATESNGPGIDTKYNFNLSNNNTPGFSIYADNTNEECSTLTSVTIDPFQWGVGNFSINNDSCVNAISEPNTNLLLGLGLLGLLLSARRLKKCRIEDAQC